MKVLILDIRIAGKNRNSTVDVLGYQSDIGMAGAG